MRGDFLQLAVSNHSTFGTDIFLSAAIAFSARYSWLMKGL